MDFLLRLSLQAAWSLTLKMTRVCRHYATQRFLSVIASEQGERGNPKSKNNAKFMACHARLTPYSQ